MMLQFARWFEIGSSLRRKLPVRQASHLLMTTSRSIGRIFCQLVPVLV